MWAGTFLDRWRPVMGSSFGPDARPNQISRQLPKDKTPPSKYSHLTSFPQQYAICTQKNMGRSYATPKGSDQWSVSKTVTAMQFSSVSWAWGHVRLSGSSESNDMIMGVTRLSSAVSTMDSVMFCECDLWPLITLEFNVSKQRKYLRLHPTGKGTFLKRPQNNML